LSLCCLQHRPTGTLTFTVGHSEYNSLGLGAQEECDIILDSAATNISLCHRKVSHYIYWVCGSMPKRSFDAAANLILLHFVTD
jgi:hypothetical protein